MFPRFAGLVLLLLVFGALQANADTIYDINGTLEVRGNGSNPSVIETIKYSFELDYTKLIGGYIPTVVGAPRVAAMGSLGTFFLDGASAVAEIDLLLFPLFSPSGQAWLNNCTNMPGGACAPFNIGEGVNLYGTASVHGVRTPEPGTLCLVLCGALALCLMKKVLTH
jgi:hypothetical protein